MVREMTVPVADRLAPPGTRPAQPAIAAARSGRPGEPRSLLLDALSRELRTTLALVSGYSQTLLHLDVEDTAHGLYLARIAAASDRVAAISEEMVSLASTESDAPPAIEPVALGGMLAGLARALADEPGAPRLDCRLPPDLPLVHADPIWMGNVLRNLVTGIGGTPADRRPDDRAVVIVTARVSGDSVVVTVRSDAAPAAVRADSYLLCRRLVEAQGGRLWREGGAGASISFSIPRARVPIGVALGVGDRRPRVAISVEP